jgi:hypothetical protein
MGNVLIIFLGLTIVACIYFSVLMNKIRRTKATYAIYETRDKFVSLVANEIVAEDSPFFKYYYKRINSLLSHAPNIGYDDAIKTLIKERNNVDFAKSLQRAKIETEEILNCKEMQHQEAAEAAELYYKATREMILAHSSVVRFTYYIVSHIGNDMLRKLIFEKLPAKIQQAHSTVRFAGEEASHLSEGRKLCH